MIYLWCHELEGANHGALHLVHPTKFSGKPEVNQLDPSVLIKDYVFSLDISMDDPIAVKELESYDDVRDNEL